MVVVSVLQAGGVCTPLFREPPRLCCVGNSKPVCPPLQANSNLEKKHKWSHTAPYADVYAARIEGVHTYTQSGPTFGLNRTVLFTLRDPALPAGRSLVYNLHRR